MELGGEVGGGVGLLVAVFGEGHVDDVLFDAVAAAVVAVGADADVVAADDVGIQRADLDVAFGVQTLQREVTRHPGEKAAAIGMPAPSVVILTPDSWLLAMVNKSEHNAARSLSC